MSLKRSQHTPEPEEGTPLLHDGNPLRKNTPLPITQIVVLILLQVSEPITSSSIKPYINQLASELPIVGGDERKIGYYAGLLMSMYFAAQAVTVLQWSRLSDRVGRKPVLLCGLLGTIGSSLLFGLSRSFSALVISRCLNGMLNGNTGVMKSMMAELTDESNMARGFSLIPVTWAIGGTLGPFIGGMLSRPQDRWPNLFSHPFWGEYPYFLPCLATATFVLLLFSVAAIFLKEVGSPLTVNRDSAMKRNTKVNSGSPRVGVGEILDGPAKDMENPLPLRALLTRPVVVSVANYCVIALLDITAGTLIPLVWSTSVEFGGLNMTPASIGLWISGYGLMNGVFQFVALPRLVGRFGPRRVFITSVLCHFPFYMMFPLANLVLRHSSSSHGRNLAVALLIMLQLTVTSISAMGMGAIFMYISTAAPNKRSLGATNGIAQTMVSIQRTVGPAAVSSLFAFSLENNILGGNFAYVVMLGVVSVGLGVAMQLPKKTWRHNEHGPARTLVSELSVVGGDERKVGYYAGLLMSLFFAAQAVTVLQWSRLSDRVGCKPVLLCGLLGTIVSSLLFGLSRSFSALVFSRCLHGALNGNTGVMKSMMAELTDKSNMARAFSLISVTWAVGGTIGPFIGGVLLRPQDRWPNIFSHPFWAKYQYFLPCLGTATYSLLSFSLAAIFLKETVNSDSVMKTNTKVNSDPPRVGEGEALDGPAKDTEMPLPLRALLTRPVVVSVANYSVIALLDIICGAIIPLVWSTSVEFGGLGMSPASIGLWMGGYGFVNGLFQFVAFPHIVKRIGPRRVFIASILCFVPIYMMLPFENLALRHSRRGLYPTVAILIMLQFTATSFSALGFGAVFMYTSTAAPNRRSLGATNGIAQTMVAIQRTISPASAASLFAFSLKNNVLGGNFAYVVMLGVVGVGLGIAVQLPKDTWKHNEQ
ncbi:Major facilitator superfamily domain containing protein [Lactarius tabidus]